MSQWKQLYEQIVTTDVCCGCSICVVVCPHKVLEYDYATEKPYQTDTDGPGDCSHGKTGCDICSRACPRLDNDTGVWKWIWPDMEQALFGRTRLPEESFGIFRSVILARAADPQVLEAGQDGSVGSALILHGLASGALDGAVVSGFNGSTQVTEPRLVTTSEDVLATGRSRYTYCATPMALLEAHKQKLRKLAMVGVSCEIAAAPMMAMNGVRKWSNKIALTIGLMCSETFLSEPFLEAKLQGTYGVDMTRVKKINVKGRVVVTYDDDTDVEVPLAEARELARPWGCPTCPDFSAEYADLSLGGLGMDGWTMVVIRTERGETFFDSAVAAGGLETRPAAEEPKAYDLMERLAKRQRRRGRNVEREIGGRIALDVVAAEALVKRDSPQAAFRAQGTADASPMAEVAIAGASPLGESRTAS